jgi:hypothetical protein
VRFSETLSTGHIKRPEGSNLTLERLAIKIWWQGYSGMKLHDVKPKLWTMSSFEEAPDIIVLHCGGNDLGQHSIGRKT